MMNGWNLEPLVGMSLKMAVNAVIKSSGRTAMTKALMKDGKSINRQEKLKWIC